MDTATFWSLFGATWGFIFAALGVLWKRTDAIKDDFARRDDMSRDLERIDRSLEQLHQMDEQIRKRVHEIATTVTILSATRDL